MVYTAHSTSTYMYMHVYISICMYIHSPIALWRCIYMHIYTCYYTHNAIHTVYGDNLYIYILLSIIQYLVYNI